MDSERYVLACYRYIELNPVRAAMVASPESYRWSSHARNAQGVYEARITPHSSYQALGCGDAERQAAYRRLFVGGINPDDAETLRVHTRQQKPWGSDKFRQQIEALVQRSLEVRSRGRPRSGTDK